jgi:Fic family protein
MDKWRKSMNPMENVVLSSELIRIIGEIDEFKGRWEALGNLAPDRLSALKRIATIESVGSSTRIEGVKLTDPEIEQLLSGIDIKSFASRDEEEVAGYAELMELIFQSYQEIDLNENNLQQLHGILLKYSKKDTRHKGHYKTHPNHVEAFDSKGKSLGVVFKTASPFDTPRLMTELTDWVNQAMDQEQTHILLIIAVFVVRFLAIHPFQDGNGRLSRALTTLLLLRAGYGYVPYSSLERVVEDTKEDYYRSLRRAQATIDVGEAQLNEWLEYFIRALRKQKQALERKIETENLMAPLAPLSEKLLKLAREHGRITVKEAAGVTGVSRNTIKDHLRNLVEAGRLSRRGSGRGTYYEISK